MKEIIKKLTDFRDTWFIEYGVATGEQWQEITDIINLLNKPQNPEVCDATTDDSSTNAGNKKLPSDVYLLTNEPSELLVLEKGVIKGYLKTKRGEEANTKTPSIYPSDEEVKHSILNILEKNTDYAYGFMEFNYGKATDELYQLFKNHS